MDLPADCLAARLEMAHVREELIEKHVGGSVQRPVLFRRQHPLGDVADHFPHPQV